MDKVKMARENLRAFVSEIDKKIDSFWDAEIGANFGLNAKQKELNQKILLHSKEHNLRTAKRLRGAFTYYSYLLGAGRVDARIWKACIALELVQTALLMHDDFMDRDALRRGKPTTHKYFEKGADAHYGESMAVTTGDAVLCLGFDLLANSGFAPGRVQKAVSKMMRGITQTAYGQAFDLTLENIQDNLDENDVISVHKAKTSIYTYENPLFIGAYLAGLDTNVYPILHDYSMDGGVAFQLQDDILGIFGNSEKTGKSADSDLLAGKCTLLILRVLSHGTQSQKDALKRAWGKRDATSADIQSAKQAIIDSGSLVYSKNISREYAKRASVSAGRLRELKLKTDAIDFLESIALYMVEREL